MLNEFIVWDEDNKKFIDESYPFFINSSGLLCLNRNSGQMSLASDLQHFNYIGKTDIEDKKIYADSSIVELKLKNYDSLHHHKSVFVGFFTYSEASLSFAFITTNSRKQDVAMCFPIMHLESLKVIGTLQETKELLNV